MEASASDGAVSHAALLRVIDQARQLNATIDVARLERMRFIYRSWIASASSVEGGFSLTRDELDCVLEYPPQREHVDFLMETFRTTTESCDASRIDLLTLLAACAGLARGALDAKAKFLFTLVDLDTEDEIVEDELAMLIALCSDGLRRLGVVVTELDDLDARAMACEAFEVVGVDDGAKMSLALFVEWIVSHWRPAALVDRIQSLFLISTVARCLHEALQQHTRAIASSPFHMYNAVHFEKDLEAEKTRVVVGPIVGPVTSSEVRLLLEVNRATTVQLFAFRVEPTSAQPQHDRICKFALEPWTPQVLIVDGLHAGETYQIRLLGVCTRDRERCVAVVTTRQTSSDTDDRGLRWELRAINHDGFGHSVHAYRRLRHAQLEAAAIKAAMMSVHFSSIALDAMEVMKMSDLLRHETPTTEAMVRKLLYQCFRDSLNRPALFDLLRIGSNFLFSSRHHILHHESTTTASMTASRDLVRIALDPWRWYIGMLWGLDTDDAIATIHHEDRCILLKFDQQRDEGDATITEILPNLSLTQDLIVITTQPLLAVSGGGKSSEANGPAVSEVRPDEVTALVEWKRVLLARNVCLVSRHAVAGFQSRFIVKNTTISIPQIVCGPASGYAHGSSIETLAVSSEFPGAIVSTDAPTVAPHCVKIRCVVDRSSSRPSSHAASSRPTSRSTLRSSHGNTEPPSNRLVSEFCLLRDEKEVRILTGPVVGMTWETSASLVLECDHDETMDVCLTDRFTSRAFVSSLSLMRNRPRTCRFYGLSPGRVYNVSVKAVHTDFAGLVRTPTCKPASTRILLLGDDTFCSLPATGRRAFAPTDQTSLMGSIRQHLTLGPHSSPSTIMYDMTIHVGAIAAFQHDLLQGYHTMQNNHSEVRPMDDRLEEMIRACYRSYTAIPDVRALRSFGTNWFSGIGVMRSLLQRETPIHFLEVVQKVIREYENSDATLDRHESRLIHKLTGQVYVVTLDTTDCLFGPSSPDFVEWPETILTARQLSAIRHILFGEGIQTSSRSASSRQVIVLCDAPFVWPFTLDTVKRSKSDVDKVQEIAKDPWNAYHNDLQRLLGTLFDAVAKDPLLRITLVCSGLFASRVVITHKLTGRSIEQLSLGTISNIDREPPQVARYTPDCALNAVGDEYTITGQAAGGTLMSLKQYCLLDVVPHARGAVCNHSFYTAGRPDASIILGPIIGRVTTRTARILVEVDRPAQSVSCILFASSSGHSVSADMELGAFVPTIFKLEGLHPGTRYKIKFEGLMTGHDDIDAYIETPALSLLTVEWLVFSRNNLQHFLPPLAVGHSRDESHWHRILSPGVRSYHTKPASIASNRNGDTLGDSVNQQSLQFNPWYYVESFALSEPLRQTQLSVHVGGQVDLSTAFADDELCLLVAQLCDPTLSEQFKNELYGTVRLRLQEVYRNTWAVEPMRTILGYSSNTMLLHDETDLFFSAKHIQAKIEHHASIDDTYNTPTEDEVGQAAARLKSIAFELWQLYQNQLSVDVNESDLDNSRRNSSKFASYLSLGMCRLIFVNISDELRDVWSNISSADQAQTRPKTPKASDQVVPLALPVENADSPLTLFSSATWKILDEALDIMVGETSTANQQGTRTKPKKGTSSVKQLVVFLPIDLIELVAAVPVARSEVLRLLEKLFQWKMGARAERNVTLLCPSERSSSTSFTVTDEKVNETLTLTRVSSISEFKEAQITKPTQGKSKAANKSVTTIKGYFSKRFTYQSHPVPTSSSIVPASETQCRSYARYMFLSDYRQGFLNENLLLFPSRALPTIVVGPVVGRLIRTDPQVPDTDSPEDTKTDATFSVAILVEVSAPARLTCVVVDSMINFETRIVREFRADEPAVFCIHGLVPLRRYVYFIEGVSNSESRRGCFHTPPSNSNCLNLAAVSSNFPTHMDEEQDSLWVPLLERAKLPWCGLDAIVHLGGQVPLHEAAIECFEWAHRELQREILHGDPAEVDAKRVVLVRAKVRRRFQQEYRICWNLPNIRELLAHSSQWFLQSKADIAPFYGRESPGPVESSRARSLVVDVAKQVVFAYQTQLMTAIETADRANVDHPVKAARSTDDVKSNPAGSVNAMPPVPSAINLEALSTQQIEEEKMGSDPTIDQSAKVEDDLDTPVDTVEDTGGALCWQHNDIAVFMGDMRNQSMGPGNDEAEPITCNGRLSRPLSSQENPMMSERQWKYLESVLRKKRTLLLVLCMELPLILTNADHVEKLRDELRSSPEPTSRWKQYDHNHVLQHWVACKRQLEQLLLILFKWKAKRSGRDVLILSGGMRIGIDTMLQDRETNLSIRNLSVGPVTASVETFEFPLSGVACATFGGGVKDEHFTFRHGLLAKKNYLLLQVSVEQPTGSVTDKAGKQDTAITSEAKTSNVVADFVPNEPAALGRLHPIDKFRRFPVWWTTYVPMGNAVFWDDTITLKSETDDQMLALRDYLWHDRGFSGALEVFYEKYQFAETARMEDLRSRHLQHVDLKANFLGVLTDLWRAIPDSKRQQMAYFLDPFVLEMLMEHVAPDLFQQRLQSGEPIELTYFSRVIRDFVLDACLLRLTIITQQEDEVNARQAAIEKRQCDAELAAQERACAEQAAQQEATRMAELLRTDPLQYAKIKLAEEEAEKQAKQARHQEKLARKKAERLAEIEEEQAIAKEQIKLNKLAERDAVEYERRQQELDARIRKLEEKRAQRAAQKKAAAEKAEKEKEKTSTDQ